MLEADAVGGRTTGICISTLFVISVVQLNSILVHM